MPRTPSFAVKAMGALALLVGLHAVTLGATLALLAAAVWGWREGGAGGLLLAAGGVAAAVLVLWGLLRLRPPPLPRPGLEVTAADHPALFAEIREVADRLGTPMPARVYLLAGVDAYAAETGGWLGLGATRVLGVGAVRLSLESVSELRATLGHELGHFVAGRTRLAATLHQARDLVGRSIDAPAAGALRRPFTAWGRLFLRATRGLSRQQELEADAAAVEVAGPAAHADSLEREARCDLLFSTFVADEIQPLVDRGFFPANALDAFRAWVEELGAQGQLPDLECAMAGHAAGPRDNHPSLAERVARARALPDAGVVHDERPARTLLSNGERWERELSARLAERLGNGTPLAPVEWSDVTERVWAPQLAAEGRHFVARAAEEFGCAPTAAAALEAVVRTLGEGGDAAVAILLEPALRSLCPADRERYEGPVLSRALGTLLGSALIEAGGHWRVTPGRPIDVALGVAVLQPWELAEEALADRELLPELLHPFRS